MTGSGIYVYEKDRETLNFLESFFERNKGYPVRFFTSVKTLKKTLKESPPRALVAGSPHSMEKLGGAIKGVPVIAMVSGDVTGGIKSVVKSGVDCYLIAPYYEDDFKYKLRILCERGAWLGDVYKEKKDLEAIVELTYLVSSSLNPQEVLFFVVKKISEMVNVTRCSILSLASPGSRHITVVSTFEDPALRSLKLELRKYPEIRKALSTKRPVVVKDAMKDPLMKSVRKVVETIGIKSIVVLPMIFRDEVIGTLFLRTSRAERKFTPREVDMFTAIANASSNALHNAFLYEKVKNEKERLEKLSITDYLTGVYNIRYLYHRLEGEFSRASRYKIPLSCIMFDLDHFKKINDNFGHRVGDMVLREFAQLVRSHTRKSDVFARYGGEEFIMLLSHTSLEGAVAEGERLKDVIRKHRFKSIRKKDFRLTTSMGVASLPNGKVKTYDDLIALADDALFEAKAMGRDMLVASK